MVQPKSTSSTNEQKSGIAIFINFILIILVLATIIVILLSNNKSLLKSALQIPFVNRVLPSAHVAGDQIPKKTSNQKPLNQKVTDQKIKAQNNNNLNNQQVQNNTVQQNTQDLSQHQSGQQIQAPPGNKHIKEAKDIANAYASMSPSKAASILDNLSIDEVVYAMTEMSSDERSNIWSKMDPAKAADLSLLLKPRSTVTDNEVAQLQQKVNVIVKNKLKNQSIDELLNTYSKMPPVQAAKLIDRLMNLNSTKTLSMLKKMDPNLRAQILTAMSSDPNMISTATTISQYLLQ
ncbi:hypothetical protein PASE110613_05225 [Paenibacillus sediminis]|uniref:Flagellar motility protein MotE (MotC chaperone) n=1 Tax=Paenibacillus sediminis TaxID=664909 RepID=A0ABS4H117_9BACL|nr:hypothetical protein [Paenibacillus sediminis]MBP1936176.1 flagellar motility protein MotE (MotC chaperone) [Paenibacillus sediminis]